MLGTQTMRLSTIYNRHTTAEFGTVTYSDLLPGEFWYPAQGSYPATLTAVANGIKITNTSTDGYSVVNLVHSSYITARMPSLKGYEAMIGMTFRVKGSAPYTFGLCGGLVANGSGYLGCKATIKFGTDGKLRICKAPTASETLSYASIADDGVQDFLYESAAIPNFSFTEVTTWELALFLSKGTYYGVRAVLSINGRVAKETDLGEDVSYDNIAHLVNESRPFVTVYNNTNIIVEQLTLVRS